MTQRYHYTFSEKNFKIDLAVLESPSKGSEKQLILRRPFPDLTYNPSIRDFQGHLHPCKLQISKIQCFSEVQITDPTIRDHEESAQEEWDIIHTEISINLDLWSAPFELTGQFKKNNAIFLP